MSTLPADKIIKCFYDSSEDCVKVLDPSGILLSFNPNGLKAMEIDDLKAVIGKDWRDFWQGDLHTLASNALDKAIDGQVAKFEGYCPTFKGTMKYWEVTVVPLFNDFNEIQWLLVDSKDATSRINMEKELLSLRKQIALLEKSSNKSYVSS